MKRIAFAAVVFAMVPSLAACGAGPGLTGNSTGGIIQWTPDNQKYARDYAAQHCGYYGKIAQIHWGTPRPGEYISFTCQFPTEGYDFRYSR
jgi:hypothetical protein